MTNKSFTPDTEQVTVTCIKVVGVGGGGGNAVDRMVTDGMQGVEFIVMNTDQQALMANHAPQKVQLGAKLTKGRGAGAEPEIGQRAAEESKDDIANALKGAQILFITAGMGGGTGTGAAPVVAEVARDLGILTVGIVTKPFAFEGRRKMGLAEQGIASMMMHVDSLIVIPNERLKLVSQEKITLKNAFAAADNVLRQGVESISDLINVPSLINLDFADVRSVMKDAGYAHMGVGYAEGEGKAEAAAMAAIASPLLETSIDGARGVIINITCPSDITLEEVDTTAGLIMKSAHPDANVIFGTNYDDSLGNAIRVTVVATGFDRGMNPVEPALSEVNMGAAASYGSYAVPHSYPTQGMRGGIPNMPMGGVSIPNVPVAPAAPAPSAAPAPAPQPAPAEKQPQPAPAVDTGAGSDLDDEYFQDLLKMLSGGKK